MKSILAISLGGKFCLLVEVPLISIKFLHEGNATKSTKSKKRQRPASTLALEASRVNDDGPDVVQEGGKQGQCRSGDDISLRMTC